MAQLTTRLLEGWRSRFHPAASRQQLSIAFALLAGGAALAVLGVVVVWLGDTVLARPSWLRELGFVAAAAGLPVFLGGLVAGLPIEPWTAALGLLGFGASVAGIAIFSLLYPERWYLQVQAPNTYAIGSYLLGVSLEAAAASAALASSFVERYSTEEEGTQGPPEVSDAEVESDLAWASRQGWSWGGIPRGQDAADIQLELEDEEPTVVHGTGLQGRRRAEPAEATEEAAVALSGLRGQRPREEETGVADQTQQLRSLKRTDGEQRSRSLWWKIRHPWRWLRER